MPLEPIALQGRGVTLLSLDPLHAGPLFEAAEGHPEIWDYMPLRVNTLQDMRRFVAEALTVGKERNRMSFAILDHVANRLVGSTRIHDYSPTDRSLEIGWTWLVPDVWRTHVNTECKFLLLRYSFETLNCIRVQLKTDGRNLRSQRAIERLGAIKEGVLRKHRLVQSGFFRDSVYYSILAEEWPEIGGKLDRLRPAAPLDPLDEAGGEGRNAARLRSS